MGGGGGGQKCKLIGVMRGEVKNGGGGLKMHVIDLI